IRFEEYAERWDEIAEVFAREAILKGSFDKYAASHKRRGTAEVDAAFLAEIEHWREQLARNIALRNAAISQHELNHAVQQTIDRIIFLRIAEDRGIEDYGRLMALQNGGATYKRMLEMFRAADVRYNSGLFHFDSEKGRAGFPDEITPNLVIDDKTLKSILSSLYYPDSPYEFSVLPSDILGQVYEQFLGKVIRLTAGHRAVVEDKPEVKKAGGVYYTPTYIVDYIVRHTVGQLLEDTISQGVQRTRGMMSRIKTPRQAAKLTICDPACGSGSFLLGAYQYLLDWHLKWYVDNEPEKWFKGRNPNIFQAGKGEWRLTTSERKRILLNNIYGVDIDAQAVEVTKLSLLLKVLENETEDTLGRQMAMFHERALPDLGHNIKCGNSLIGPDFYDQQEFSLMAEEDRYRINVFDWQA
ncbi:MAG: N-6 DNA methylase, partial [Mariprofundaceae bacterium]|nr:N-6 DNA methylase [Mariprofundaceae bacterium]